MEQAAEDFLTGNRESEDGKSVMDGSVISDGDIAGDVGDEGVSSRIKADTEEAEEKESKTGIRAIDSASVHRIHSGQVILTLEGALKELVENSIDAGATSIEVRIRDNGLESIEVIDNGSGIRESDWESVALKHRTSKLTTYADLDSVTTFGFRGEALSALCALSESVTISTATQDSQPLGRQLRFDRTGHLLDSSDKVARQHGTTVTATRLFGPLPVRRKEFERNAKRDLAKALNLMTAYALVPACRAATPLSVSEHTTDRGQGIRLSVDTVSKTGRRTNHLRTDGKSSIRSAVTAIWGPKSADNLIDVDLELEVEMDKVMAKREGLEITSQTVLVKGLISSAAFGEGRNSTDRQFFYINGRPFSPNRIAKVINEVYRSFNTNQSPFVILDFQMPTNAVDVNVSPDKREIYVHSEGNLLEAIRLGFEALFQPSRSTFVDNTSSHRSKENVLKRSRSESVAPSQSSEAASEDADMLPKEDIVDETSAVSSSDLSGPRVGRERKRSSTPTRSPAFVDLNVRSSPRTPSTSSTPLTPQAAEKYMPSRTLAGETNGEALTPDTLPSASLPSATADSPRTIKLSTATAAWRQILDGRGSEHRRGQKRPLEASAQIGSSSSQQNLRARLAGYASQKGSVDLQPLDLSDREDGRSSPDGHSLSADDSDQDAEMHGKDTEDDSASIGSEEYLENFDAREQSSAKVLVYQPKARLDGNQLDASASTVLESSMEDGHVRYVVEASFDAEPLAKDRAFRDEILSKSRAKHVKIEIDIEEISRNAEAAYSSDAQRSAASPGATDQLLPDAGADEQDSEKANRVLNHVIAKDDFAEMDILGQFNKAFIIARRNGGEAASDDLFIIDQHASDEKYNFETLQSTTQIMGQKLIRPQKLELSSAEEITAVEHLDILKRNGFDLLVDEDAPFGRGERIKLLSMPISKDTVFDAKDLAELIYLLQEQHSGQMVRCKKARAMFAMRACRKSVMFGKPLTRRQMTEIVRHMGVIDQPWNCPHGRPTMRHLVNLEKLRAESGLGTLDRRAATKIDWTHVKL